MIIFKRLFGSERKPTNDKINSPIFKPRSFEELANEWLEFHHIEIEESTYYGYKKLLPCLIEYFGESTITDLDTRTINQFILGMKQDGMTDAAVYNYCRILALCFDYACVNKYIVDNPVRSACVPRLPKHIEVRPFSIQEVMSLLKLDYLQWVKDGIVIAFHTGMRTGEIYALKWTDIDFEQRFIMVQRAQSKACSKVVLKTTKTACGIRRIDIDKYFVLYLKNMKERSRSDFVFDPVENSEYQFRVPWNLSAHIKRMCMIQGIPPRNFYAFRHTHATILLAHGIHPKIVQERLGHSDIGITVMTYSHVLPTIQKEAVKVFEGICGEYYAGTSDAAGVFDNIINLEFIQYGECYYTESTQSITAV